VCVQQHLNYNGEKIEGDYANGIFSLEDGGSCSGDRASSQIRGRLLCLPEEIARRSKRMEATWGVTYARRFPSKGCRQRSLVQWVQNSLLASEK
jgi:hypothetical protein